MTAPDDLVSAVKALWAIPPPDCATPSKSRAFRKLVDACSAISPTLRSIFGDFALDVAVRALGPPWLSVGDVAFLAPPAEVAAQRLVEALRAKSGRRVHLCPLDLADDLPDWHFGPNIVRRFTEAELNALVRPSRLLREHPSWVFDSRAFAYFHWLAVEEVVPLDPVPAYRAMPMLTTRMAEIDGRILPHAAHLPEAVERALFALLLLPWEQATDWAEFDWRSFRLPWVYTVDDDIFARPTRPPDPATLTWRPVALHGPNGEVEEAERPQTLPLRQDVISVWPLPDHSWWHQIDAARASSMFGQPIAHFLVRAFTSDGVDEFLAHLTAIEAALGSRDDYPIKGIPRRGKRQPAGSSAVRKRAAMLLGRKSVEHLHERLFRARSDFLHGREMGAISARSRNVARALARRVCQSVVDQASINPSKTRDDFLFSLCPVP